MYDSPLCTNSTYWSNFRTVQVFLGLVGIIAAIVTIVLFILYSKNKKKFKLPLIISFICTVVFLLGSVGLGIYIHNETKDLLYCWGVK